MDLPRPVVLVAAAAAPHGVPRVPRHRRLAGGLPHCWQACSGDTFEACTACNSFLSSAGQSVRLLTSRSGVRASQGAFAHAVKSPSVLQDVWQLWLGTRHVGGSGYAARPPATRAGVSLAVSSTTFLFLGKHVWGTTCHTKYLAEPQACAPDSSIMFLCVYSGFSRNKDMLMLGSLIMWQGVAGTSQAWQELRGRCNKLRQRVRCCMISCFRRRPLFYSSRCRWGEQDIAIPVADTLPARQQSPLWGLSP